MLSCCPLDFPIGELAVASGLLAGAAPVDPISTVYSATQARGLSYSLVDFIATQAQLSRRPQHWRFALREVIADVGA